MIEECPGGSITWNHGYVHTAGCAPQNAPQTGSRSIGAHRA